MLGVYAAGKFPFCFLLVGDDGYRLELQAETEDDMLKYVLIVLETIYVVKRLVSIETLYSSQHTLVIVNATV